MNPTRRPLFSGLLCLAIIMISMVNCSSTTATSAAPAAAPDATADSALIFPAPLRPGNKIAIVSPAGPVAADLVNGAADVLRSIGYKPVIYPHALGRRGYYSGTDDERFDDLAAALTDTTVKAVLCSRGGYGAVHILDRIAALPLRDNAKWLIGFSDISALHALLASRGIASVHGPMAKSIMKGTANSDNRALFDILAGSMPSYTFAPSPLNHTGEATGRLVGGNVAVLADLISTPYDILAPGTILFIEDVAEPIYKIERILYQLRLNGVLDNLAGLVVGEFTDYKPDGVHTSMEAMIADMVKDCKFPIAFGVPFGHGDNNAPLVESSTATLRVTPESVTLTLSK